MSNDGLARTLEGLNYSTLFLSMDDATQRKILSGSGAVNGLRSIVLDSRKLARTRFLAAELLATASGELPKGLPASVLAQVYVGGLRSWGSQVANPWGLPGNNGPLSQRVLALGSAATAPLLETLDDNEPMLYGGSRDATVGNSFRWRVKDQAAALLAALQGERLEPDRDPHKRDQAIAALRGRIHRDGKA